MHFSKGNIQKYGVYFIKIALIALLLVVVNSGLVGLGKLEFLGETLPSELVAHNVKKSVTDLNQVGNLTFGPYVSLEAGSYQVTIYYSTNTDLNTIDVFSGQMGKKYYESQLIQDSMKKTFKLVLDEKISDIEIRSFYNGKGYLEIEKIVIEESIGLIRVLINMLIICFIFIYEIKIKHIGYEKKYVCFAFCLLCIPMILTTIYNMTNKKIDLELKGNFTKVEKPNFEISDFISRDFQADFEGWWNENFVSRGYIITAYNQIRYSFFDLGNRIIGKEKSLFEEAYINDLLSIKENYDYSLEYNQIAMKTYMEQLENISRKLKEVGKEFLVYTTLSKAAEETKDVPYKYVWKYKDDNKIRAIDYFRSIVDSYDFCYIDSSEIFLNSENKYPVFYKTGIHWSRPIEQEVSLSILNELYLKGVQVGCFDLISLQESKIPYWRDADLYDVLNIYKGTMDETYYEYETTIVRTGTANILIQGGSFALGFKKDFIENQAGTDIVDIFYNQYVEKSDGTKIPITSWNSLDLENYIEQADVIIIEINEHVLSNYSDGFVEYLSSYLEKINVDQRNENINFYSNTDISKNLLLGFYEQENGYRWIGSEAKARISNENIINKGLEVEINIPDMLSDEGSVEIIVNDVCKKTIPLENKGRQSVIFLPEELSGDGMYEIVITTSDTFCPKEEDINTDERVLGIQVFYVGEKR